MKTKLTAIVTAAALAVAGGGFAVAAAHADGPPVPGWCQSVAGSSGRVTTIKFVNDGSESYKVSGHIDRFESFQVRSPSILSGDAPADYTTGDRVDVGELTDPFLVNFAYGDAAPRVQSQSPEMDVRPDRCRLGNPGERARVG